MHFHLLQFLLHLSPWVATLCINFVLCDNHQETSFLNPDELQEMVISEEKRLTQHSLKRLEILGKAGRPVVYMSNSTAVRFGLGLIQMDLDERNKILTCSMWSKLQWKDMYLRWDPSHYGNVSVIRLESSKVWIPDIMLFNTADPEKSERNALVLVRYDGTLDWVPHQRFKSSCSIDVTNFPFDNQACHLWFGSWTHTLKDIDLNLAFPGGIDLSTFQSDYKDSCVWEIMNTTAERQLLPENDTDPVAVLTFTLNFRRKIVFSSYILTLPCVFLVTLTLVVFWLPADRPDRIGLAMSLFASFLVLLLILVEAAPPTASSVPVLGVYYCFNMVVIMFAIFLSSLVINIYRAGASNSPVPTWLHVIVVRGIGRVLCRNIRIPDENWKRKSVHQYIQVNTRDDKISSSSKGIHLPKACNGVCFCDETIDMNQGHKSGIQEEDVLKRRFFSKKSLNSNDCPVQETATNNISCRSDLKLEIKDDLARTLHFLEDNGYLYRHGYTVGRNSLEWREVGLILDRLFCLVFFIINTLSLIMLFPRPPNFTLF